MALANVGTSTGETGPLGEAMRRARLREAVHFDAVHALRDAKSLRLAVLKDELAVIVAASPAAGESFDLAISPGENPRLWIDLITSVIMEPDPKTYRLIEDTHGGREVLCESADRAEIVERIKQHMAHRIIARERHKAIAGFGQGSGGRYSPASLILAWLAGFALGALSLLLYVIYLKMLRY
jgi:hypothetical protein